ncbi:hypothetical protein [Actinophytocola sp. KF-1]
MTTPLPHPERTALLEARGATLHWDVLTDAPPVTEVHDEARAADWLWDVPATARELAYLTWAKAWWPTSVVAGVPPLDPALLAAELAVATAAVDHLLDDEDAVERAVADAATAVHPLAALAADPVLGDAATALAARLADLAEDHGITLPDPVPVRREQTGFALAAGGSAGSEVVVLRGSSPVDWALVPQGAVDAAADATWSVVRRDGGLVLAVNVPALRPVPLAARFGQVDVPLENGTGQVTVPPSVLLLPAARRTLTVFAPGFAAEPADDPDAPARRAALVAMASARLTAPDATLTERAAAR